MEANSDHRPSKKIKLSEDPDFNTVTNKLTAVLDSNYTRNVIFEEAAVCNVLDKTHLSNIIKQLSIHLPIVRFQHLKRVKNDKQNHENSVSVLLCGWEDLPPGIQNAAEASLRELCPAIDIPAGVVGNILQVSVPSHPPLTREQYQQSALVWPTNFHENKYLSRMMSGEVLSGEQLTAAQGHMKLALDKARVGLQSLQPNNGCSGGCVVVDPTTDRLLVAAHPVTTQHPLHHAVMVAIDLIARQQRGGTYSFNDVGVYMAEVELPDDTDNPTKTGPYLCTGYDVYTDTEPCVMCAMALVHSRIRRLYYAKPSPDGALGSKYRIHTQTGLNHHFEVFQGLA